MKKIVEKTLEAALIKASTELNCSVADLEYEIIQNPNSGFLGLGKKDAIIVVQAKNNYSSHSHSQNAFISQEKPKQEKPKYENFKQATSQVNLDLQKVKAVRIGESREFETSQQERETHIDKDEYGLDTQSIWGGGQSYETPKPMYSQQDNQANVEQIRKELETLFSYLPFEIHHFEVKLYENNTLYIYIDGRDCALLIGERGYRYKALSYLLFNWINPKYGYSLRLEIAEFLKNQEEMIDVYLKDVVRLVKLNGKAQTKTLDGILVYIALSKLRDLFPDKYVSMRQNEADEKYIIINDFRR